MTQITMRFRVTGRVQGVSFRWWTKGEAEALGLRGWVENRPDGSVEGVAMGAGADVTRLIEALHEGPPAAAVARVETSEIAEAEADFTAPDGFHIRG